MIRACEDRPRCDQGRVPPLHRRQMRPTVHVDCGHPTSTGSASCGFSVTSRVDQDPTPAREGPSHFALRSRYRAPSGSLLAPSWPASSGKTRGSTRTVQFHLANEGNPGPPVQQSAFRSECASLQLRSKSPSMPSREHLNSGQTATVQLASGVSCAAPLRSHILERFDESGRQDRAPQGTRRSSGSLLLQAYAPEAHARANSSRA